MPTPLNINKGENFLLARTIYDLDGTTPLAAEDLVDLQVELLQSGSVIKNSSGLEASWSLSGEDPEITSLGDSVYQVEITPAIASLFKEGRVKARWTISISNPKFPLNTDVEVKIDEVEVAIVK